MDRIEEQDIPLARYLRRLVTALAAVMGFGILAIVALLWLNLSAAPLPQLPENIVLPDGAQAAALTFARDWIVVVTDAGEVLLYDRSGALRDRVSP